MKSSEPHPWFQPIARRIGIVIICFLWLGIEIWAAPGSLWSLVAACVCGWAVWDLLLSGKYRTDH